MNTNDLKLGGQDGAAGEADCGGAVGRSRGEVERLAARTRSSRGGVELDGRGRRSATGGNWEEQTSPGSSWRTPVQLLALLRLFFHGPWVQVQGGTPEGSSQSITSWPSLQNKIRMIIDSNHFTFKEHVLCGTAHLVQDSEDKG